MSNKPTEHDVAATPPPDPIPEGRIPVEYDYIVELSVPKAILLPSAQVPAEPPKAAQTPLKPSQSDAKEK